MDAPREDPAAARRRRPAAEKRPARRGRRRVAGEGRGRGGALGRRANRRRREFPSSSSSAGRGNPRNVVAGRASSSPARPGTPFDEDAMGPEPELGGRCRADDGDVARVGARAPARRRVAVAPARYPRERPLQRRNAVATAEARDDANARGAVVGLPRPRMLRGPHGRVVCLDPSARGRPGARARGRAPCDQAAPLSTRRVALVAYSLGCQVALEWCRGNSHRVCGLALVLGSCRHAMTGALRWKPVADVAAAAMRIAPRAGGVRVGLLHRVRVRVQLRVASRGASVWDTAREVRGLRAVIYRHLKRLHAGSYTRMLISGQEHSAMDVLRARRQARDTDADRHRREGRHRVRVRRPRDASRRPEGGLRAPPGRVPRGDDRRGGGCRRRDRRVPRSRRGDAGI